MTSILRLLLHYFYSPNTPTYYYYSTTITAATTITIYHHTTPTTPARHACAPMIKTLGATTVRLVYLWCAFYIRDSTVGAVCGESAVSEADKSIDFASGEKAFKSEAFYRVKAVVRRCEVLSEAENHWQH